MTGILLWEVGQVVMELALVSTILGSLKWHSQNDCVHPDDEMNADDRPDGSESRGQKEGTGEGNELNELQELSNRLFKSFIDHRNIEEYETELKAACPSDYAASIQEYVGAIRAWQVRHGAPPYEAHFDFLKVLRPPQSSNPPPPPPPPSPPSPPAAESELRGLQEATVQFFEEYLQHRSVDQYEAAIRSSYSSDYAGVIEEHVIALRALSDANNSSGASAALRTFFHNCKAFEKRKEGEQLVRGGFL